MNHEPISPDLESWVDSANADDTDFPIQNLPLGAFRLGPDGEGEIGVAIGDAALRLARVDEQGFLDGLPSALRTSCRGANLNPLLALGRESWGLLRSRLVELLRKDSRAAGRDDLLVERARIKSLVPARVGDYTDFYASIDHARNVGSLFRPDNPLLPNYRHVPIAYHGRASSLIPSGVPVRRPAGQRKPPDAEVPSFGPTRALDYELEVGIVLGPGNPLGKPISIARAEDHVLGLCLVNDWSARDIQAWEYQPLGPFLSKSFATTVSGWVVPLDALAPFRVPAYERGADDPAPLAYLSSSSNDAAGGIDIELEVLITSQTMRDRGIPPHRLSHGSFRHMYWTVAQMVTHHASNGCNLMPGDLIASGTVSGPDPSARGCLLEITRRGQDRVALPDDETRGFLEDGDEVILRGYCQRPGHRRVGFGECRGLVLPCATE